MSKLKGQFQGLLGQTVTSIDRVALVENNELSPLMDTLLFTCCNGRRFELLVEQNTVKLEELSPTKDVFAGFKLEPSEELTTFPCTEVSRIPKTIVSLTEIWASSGETEFLVAIIFRDKDKSHIISVCTEGNEVELIMKLEEVWQRVNEMIFSYGALSHQLYTSAFIGSKHSS